MRIVGQGDCFLRIFGELYLIRIQVSNFFQDDFNYPNPMEIGFRKLL